MKTNIILFSSMALLLFSCKTNLSTVRPDENYIAPKVESKLSSIALNVDIDIPALEKSLNKSLKGVIYEDNNFEDDNLEVNVTQTADIKFSVFGNTIKTVLPLKLWVKTGYKKELFGLKAEDYYEVNGEMQVEASIVFGVDKSWKIITKTNIDKYQWTKKPYITAAGVNVPVTMVADLIILSLKGKIAKTVDKIIAEEFDLQSTMQKTWAELQDPIQIEQDHDIWLKIRPVAFCSTPIVGTGNRMKIGFSFDSYVETTVAFKPEAQAKTKLPEYKLVNCLIPDFSVYSNVAVSYKKLGHIARMMVVGQEFSQSGKRVMIDSLSFFGQGDNLVVQVAVSGSANGTFYCIGKPYYDESSRMLMIKDLDFELKTRNTLLKSANWLLHKEFLEKIEPMLEIPLGSEIDAMLTSGNDFLKEYKLAKGITLRGRLSKISFDKITITNKSIIVGGVIKGQLRLQIDDLF